MSGKFLWNQTSKSPAVCFAVALSVGSVAGDSFQDSLSHSVSQHTTAAELNLSQDLKKQDFKDGRVWNPSNVKQPGKSGTEPEACLPWWNCSWKPSPFQVPGHHLWHPLWPQSRDHPSPGPSTPSTCHPWVSVGHLSYLASWPETATRAYGQGGLLLRGSLGSGEMFLLRRWPGLLGGRRLSWGGACKMVPWLYLPPTHLQPCEGLWLKDQHWVRQSSQSECHRKQSFVTWRALRRQGRRTTPGDSATSRREEMQDLSGKGGFHRFLALRSPQLLFNLRSLSHQVSSLQSQDRCPSTRFPHLMLWKDFRQI